MTDFLVISGLRRGSRCRWELHAGMVMMRDLAECGAVDYEAAVAALLEYLGLGGQ